MRYKHTHASVHDGSPAMLVSQDEETITLVNEDGVEWTDPLTNWRPIPTPQSVAHEFIVWATENEGAGSAAVVDWRWFAEIARKYDPEFANQFWPQQ